MTDSLLINGENKLTINGNVLIAILQQWLNSELSPREGPRVHTVRMNEKQNTLEVLLTDREGRDHRVEALETLTQMHSREEST